MNRLALLVGLAIMELAWIYPWSLLLGVWVTPERSRELLSPASILALLMVGALATQGVVRTIGARRPGQAFLLALGVVGILTGARLALEVRGDGEQVCVVDDAHRGRLAPWGDGRHDDCAARR